MFTIRKYPRTPHLQGSRLQPGDDDLDQVRFVELRGRRVVVEEKLDGANAALSFDADGALLLQSRGHYLTGGAREKHFNLFKTWASAHQHRLRERLGSRYVVYGEWLYARHTVYYDALPHYFLEFDVLDREEEVFLSTERRRALLEGLPLASAPVLYDGAPGSLEALTALVGPSRYKTPGWRERLVAQAGRQGLDVERVLRETDPEITAEGLYLKLEADGRVVGRLKWVRASFLQAVEESGSHWLNRPIVPNLLAEGVDLFAEALP
jgi:hypothetical protein